MNSKKTETVTFRIEKLLKHRLKVAADFENKTISDKAKQLIIEGLGVFPQKTLTDEVKTNVNNIEQSITRLVSRFQNSAELLERKYENSETLLADYKKAIKDLEKINNNIADTNNNIAETYKKSNSGTTAKMIIIASVTSLVNLVAVAFFTGFI